LVELVPAPWTEKQAMIRTREIMEQIGQEPVSLTREIEGFALNRIQ
jgi:L-gulonate 3-dehydrogenase